MCSTPLPRASRRLAIFPAVRAHEKASTKLGVTALRAPFVPGTAYDFGQLGEVVSTTLLPAQAALWPHWQPVAR